MEKKIDLNQIMTEETQKFLQENRKKIIARVEKRLKQIKKDRELTV